MPVLPTPVLPLLLLAQSLISAPAHPDRYLAFQFFTGTTASDDLRGSFPPPPADLRTTVHQLRDRIGSTGTANRHLGFIVGPLSFDHTDAQINEMIAGAFEVARDSNVAVGFHLDDSMFWGRLDRLNTPDNLEWLDWNRTPNTGRRLDWSATPRKIMPQLCVNSPAVKVAVVQRATLIGGDIAKGLRKLDAAGKRDLFLGIIAGWELQIGRDFDTGKSLGYCALTNQGDSAKTPPADLDAARVKIIRDFAGLWARTLVSSGVPETKVYSHIAFSSETMYRAGHQGATASSYLEAINWTPPAVAFCDSCVPGFSTYPQPGHLDQWRAELQKHGNPPWASCEGTAIDPAVAASSGKGMDMQGYLGDLFNHGATLVNIFGWGIGPADNPFRRTAESEEAIDAYRKFLKGEPLTEAPTSQQPVAPDGLPAKIHKIQDLLPAYIQANGPSKVQPLMEKLAAAVKQRQFNEAITLADQILKLIE